MRPGNPGRTRHPACDRYPVNATAPEQGRGPSGLELRGDGFASVGRRDHGDDLELDEVAPESHPLLEQTRVLTLHDLKASVEVHFDPATDVAKPVGHAASLLAKATVHGFGVAVLESLDHH